MGISALGTPELQYEALDDKGVPVLNMLMSLSGADADAAGAAHELVHSDINAVIDVLPTDTSGTGAENCDSVEDPGSSCGQPFREFTVIFHDEITAVQAFHELEDEDSPMASLRDGMGINYGAAGLGAMVLANRKDIGPAKDCAECKLEEFFLTSWAMGQWHSVSAKSMI